MLKKIFPKSDFVKNVITLVTGTAIAQAIPIAISPILTRIYSPDDFGILALFLSIVAVLSVVATGRYEFAITLPAKDEDARQILWLSCLFSILFSCVILIFVILFNSTITDILGNDKISEWLYFIPFVVLISGIYQSFNYWFNRKKKYANLSKSKITQTLTSSIVNLSVGFARKGGAFGLIFGQILGQLLSSMYLVFYFFKNTSIKKIDIKKNKVFALAKRYKDFPQYDILASFFNISSSSYTYFLQYFFWSCNFRLFLFSTKSI